MTFTETAVPGVFTIDLVEMPDERGFFAKSWTPQDLYDRGLDPTLAQCSISWNKVRGTLRGLHFQREPFGEVKIVRCTRGAVLDVVADLRPDSPAYCSW